LSEYHPAIAHSLAGFSRKSLGRTTRTISFDNQILAQIIWYGYTIAEVSCPTRCFPEASSVTPRSSIQYGFGCLATALGFRLARWRILRSALFPRPGTFASARLTATTQ